MKTNKNLFVVLVILLIFLGVGTVSAQSCKKAFLTAKEQYNGGQYENSQNLLNACITSFRKNVDYYLGNPTQVYKVYKLYIASCNKARNVKCAKAKRQELIDFFPKKGEEYVINKLNSTSF